ncbi:MULTISPECIES: hypothetical protein [Pontibacillus]|uniref:Uncharacterized protein n=1 Tax=Pontibacillus chungwhensis TaxID=265426 RepID=A0ABY8V540_9BACI|nr:MULTISPECIES: hypothetical protein [Pontibacillus]MCD5322413.1 hypothetical protein [Pontibacillus sp. HN14]WIF99699.1 hypothetical protein QNI29_08610 [Pontibacillus chungwhensis]
MEIVKGYAVTIGELFLFIAIGILVSEYGLRFIYEQAGISYMGNIGKVWFGISLSLFCLYSIFKHRRSEGKQRLLRGRVRSKTFYVVFVFSVYTVIAPLFEGAL